MITLQFLVLAVICPKCISGRGQALCSITKSTQFYGKTTYYRNYFCCRNFEETKGKCLECQRGFSTSNGEPCKPCTANKFGNKCASTCHCTKKERCDKRHGCVPLHSEISTEKLSTLMNDNQQKEFSVNISEHTLNIVYNEIQHTPTSDYENKTYRDGNGEHDSDYINYVIWTGCILFIILIVVSSSICYVLNNKLLLKHSANVNSILQEQNTKRGVLSRSERVQGPCDIINEQTMRIDYEMEIQVVNTEALNKNSN